MIESVVRSLLPSIEHLHSLAYWMAFLAAFTETALVVGLLVPGSTLLLLLGAWTAAGRLDLAGVYWFGVAGAVLGDNLNYWLGARYGQRWLERGVWFLKPEHFAQAHAFFDRNGAKSVFLGRFIPSIKEIAPFVAGSVRMRRGTFLFWNLLGGIGWGMEWIGGGYLFGQSVAVAQAWVSRIGLLFLAVLLLWLLGSYLRHMLVRRGPQVWQLLDSLWTSVSSALAANPYLQEFRRRHPGLVGFLSRRLDRSRFSGLPLTLLALALVYVAVLFGGTAEDVVTSDRIVALDQGVAQLVARFRPPEVIPVFTWITALGIPAVATPLVLVAAAGAWLARGRWLAVSLLVSAAGSAAFSALGKLAVHRPRPVEAVLLEHSYSFPSGHAAIAVGFYGFLGYVLMRSAPDLRARVNRLMPTLLVILLIGLSRVALGVHYLSDVWAGYLVGAGWLLIGIAVSGWATATHRIEWARPRAPRRRSVPWLLLAAGSAWYVVYAAQWHPTTSTPPATRTETVDTAFPALIRQRRLTHSETLVGAASQPLSVAFLAQDETALARLLEDAGWQAADPPTPVNLWKLLRQGMAYQNTPLAPVFWNGRIDDVGFDRPVVVDGEKLIDTLRLWTTPWLVAGSPVYVGVVRSYAGISWGVLHRIAPDTDAALRRLLQSIGASTPAPATCVAKLGQAEIGTYLLGMQFFSSGDFAVVDLREHPSGSLCGPP